MGRQESGLRATSLAKANERVSGLRAKSPQRPAGVRPPRHVPASGLRHCTLGRRRCGPCRWQAYGQHWEARYQAKLPTGTTSWLADLVVDGRWGVGCLVCGLAGEVGTTFARSEAARAKTMRPQIFDKHEASAKHIAAHLRLPGRPIDQHELVTPPPLETFAGCWRAFKKSRTMEQPVGATVFRRKACAVQWCLAEAVRRIDRDFISKAECITLSQDATESRLLARFVAADAELNVRRGVLG